MVEFIRLQIRELMRKARDSYPFDPVVCLAIYFACVPLFHYSLLRMIQALARTRGTEALLWSSVVRCETVAQFLSVLFFGTNLPWWVNGIIVVLIGQGVFSLMM